MPSGTWALGWALNDVVTVAEFAKGQGCIFDSTVGGTPAASFDITGIPTTSYAHLVIICQLRSDTAAPSTSLLMRINNDSAANYDYQHLFGNIAAAGSTEVFAGTSAIVGAIPAATAPASVFGGCDMSIPNYVGTIANKTVETRYAMKTATVSGGLQTGVYGAFWRSSAAVSRITLLPQAGLFVSGSRVGAYVVGA